MATPERDSITGTPTTGHEWDGIKELNNALAALVAVDVLRHDRVGDRLFDCLSGVAIDQLCNDRPSRLFEPCQCRARHRRCQGRTRAVARSHLHFKPRSDCRDPELLAFARAGGAAAFRVNCVQCHGSGAAGGKGYPNLNDDDWLWGGTLEQIHKTLENGIRFAANPDTRDSQMPVFAEGILDAGRSTR